MTLFVDNVIRDTNDLHLILTIQAGYIANLILEIQNDDFQPTLQKILLVLPNFWYENIRGCFHEIEMKANITSFTFKAYAYLHLSRKPPS